MNRHVRKKLFSLFMSAIIAISTFGAAALGSGLTHSGSQNGGGDGQSGTTLTAYVTAQGFWKRIKNYDWSLLKTGNPTSLTLSQGQQGQVQYTITATRGQPTITDMFGVSGQVSVTNGGAVTTENLTITVQVQYKVGSGPFMDLAGASQTITPPPAPLGAGQTGLYNYQINFTPVSGATYRVVAHVTITNHSGSLGIPFGPNPKADFSLPSSPTVIYKDATASLNDVQTIPAGFTAVMTPSLSFPMTLTDTTVVNYTKTVTNVSAGPGTYYVDNTATLTESDTHRVPPPSSVRVTITVQEITKPPPPPPTPTGRGFTPGYWKNHTDVWPSPYLPSQTVGSVFSATSSYPALSSATLLQALGFKGGSTFQDAVKILLRSAVAAVLNSTSFGGPPGGYPLTTAQVISQVNAAIASGDRSTVLSLANILDSYNNLGGP